MPTPFHMDALAEAKANPYFRQEKATLTHCQVTLMTIPPGGEVGEETHHDVDQVLMFVTGTGKAILNDVETPIEPGSLYAIPMGTKHNFVNTGADDLKIISVYSPPEHPVGTVHKTKDEADAAEATGH